MWDMKSNVPWKKGGRLLRLDETSVHGLRNFISSGFAFSLVTVSRLHPLPTKCSGAHKPTASWHGPCICFISLETALGSAQGLCFAMSRRVVNGQPGSVAHRQVPRPHYSNSGAICITNRFSNGSCPMQIPGILTDSFNPLVELCILTRYPDICRYFMVELERWRESTEK